MIKRLLIIVCVVVLSAGYAVAGEFIVIKVYDGDTCMVKGHDIKLKVRLVGIDTPEKKWRKRPAQPYSKKAGKHLASLILDRTVDLHGYGLGPYNRVLGETFVGGVNVNLAMVKAGYAEVYRGKPPKGFNTDPYVKGGDLVTG